MHWLHNSQQKHQLWKITAFQLHYILTRQRETLFAVPICGIFQSEHTKKLFKISSRVAFQPGNNAAITEKEWEKQFTELQNQNINDTPKPPASNNDLWIQYAQIIPSAKAHWINAHAVTFICSMKWHPETRLWKANSQKDKKSLTT